jgi:hypothetical protein
VSGYDTDVLAWSEQQAALLRRLARGERVNQAVLDWDNIIDEIETVGRSEVAAVESLWTQAFLHELKAAAWPDSPDAASWQADARLFRRQAKRKFTPSMRQKIDLAQLYDDALAGLPGSMDGRPPRPVPRSCPVTLDELLASN